MCLELVFLRLLTCKLTFLFCVLMARDKKETEKKTYTRLTKKQRIMEKGAGKILFGREKGGFPIIRMYICRNTPDVLSESSTKRSKLLNNPTADARLAMKYMTKQCCGATFIS